MPTAMKRNWKTTAFGICVLLGALAAAGIALLDGNPETTVDIEEITAALAGVGLLVAGDGK